MNFQADISPHYAHLFQVGRSVNGFQPLGGNQARLLPDSNSSIDAMVADIDAASEHVHLMFYIWLPDNNGLKAVSYTHLSIRPSKGPWPPVATTTPSTACRFLKGRHAG